MSEDNTRESEASGSTHARIADSRYRDERARRASKRGAGHVVGAVIAAIVAIILISGGVLVATGLSAKADAETVVASAKAMIAAVTAGDIDTFTEEADNLSEASDSLNRTVHGAVWTFGTQLPFVGHDLENVQGLSDILDDLNQSLIQPVAADASSYVSGDLASEDTIDVTAVVILAQQMGNLTPALDRAAASVSEMQPGSIDQINEIIGEVKDYLVLADNLTEILADFADVLPALLGGEGQSVSYLVIAQNSAELRPTGGIPGSWGVVTIDNGKISIGSMGEPDYWTDEGIALTTDDYNLMGDYYGYMKPDIYWVSANFTPDFPTAAQYLSEYWTMVREAGMSGVDPESPSEVDGVIVLNPIILQRLLGLTDGFDVDGTHIDGTNACRVLLNDSYWGIDTDTRDDYFSTVASMVVSTIEGSLTSMDLSDLMDVVYEGAERGDFQMWFEDEALEEKICDLGWGGEISHDETDPVLGTYFYDITWSKMDWYLTADTQIGEATTNADGTVSYEVTTTLINEMTEEEAELAPDYIVSDGSNQLVANRGGMCTVVYLYAPAGGTITNLTTVGVGAQFSSTTVDGLQVYRGHVVLDPQHREVISYTVTVSADAESELRLRSTPTCTEVAGWTTDDKDNEDFELEDGGAYGTVTSDSSGLDDAMSSTFETYTYEETYDYDYTYEDPFSYDDSYDYNYDYDNGYDSDTDYSGDTGTSDTGDTDGTGTTDTGTVDTGAGDTGGTDPAATVTSMASASQTQVEYTASV